MTDQVFDEEISLKRFAVALKRADWRMFEQALGRLDEEIASAPPFSRHQAWQEMLRQAGEREDVPEPLVERFREALNRLLAVETRVTDAAPAAPADGAETVALVNLWSDGLDEPRVRLAFKTWLDGPAAAAEPAARQRLASWLAEGAGMGLLAHRANLARAAASTGLTLADPPWTATFYAGLAHALASAPPAGLAAPLAAVADAVVLTADPSPAWDTTGLAALKLGGSIDSFVCPACHAVTRAPGALAVSCTTCGAPAWPLIAPLDQHGWQPPAARTLRDQGAAALRRAGTWVLVEPPDPAADPLSTWLLGCLTPGKRVLVVGGSALEAWQAVLADHPTRAVVTSRGPAEQVLGFLLQGGVPELEQPMSGSFTPKKKGRR